MCRLLAVVLSALAPTLQAYECTGDQCTNAPSEDSALLQVARHASAVTGALGGNASGGALARQPRWCPLGHYVTTQSQIKGLASHVGWWSTPQPSLDVLEREKAKLGWLEAPQWSFEWAREFYSFSSGSGRDAAQAMFEATRGPGYEKVPDKLKGVFWMKGNGAVEELIVLHNGVWLDAETYVSPPTPFSWAWPLSRPMYPPMNSVLYTNFPAVAWGNAAGITVSAQANSFKFSTCPSDESYCGRYENDSLAFGNMQVHIMGDAATILGLGDLATILAPAFAGTGVAGRFTLQAMSGDGSHWKRTCDWGLAQCAFLEFGTYDLVKIIDGKGAPVQPNWADWLRYIGDVQLLSWSGWKSQWAMEESKRRYESMVR